MRGLKSLQQTLLPLFNRSQSKPKLDFPSKTSRAFPNSLMQGRADFPTPAEVVEKDNKVLVENSIKLKDMLLHQQKKSKVMQKNFEGV